MTTKPSGNAWHAALGTALLFPAIVQLATFAWIVLSRAAYPMDIEWLEGGELYQAYRLMHGLSVYGSPDVGYLPLLHPPGHFVVLALAGKIFGLDYATGRLVSVAFFALASASVAREIASRCATRRERLAVPLVGVAMALTSYPVVSGVYDLTRNDTTAL